MPNDPFTEPSRIPWWLRDPTDEEIIRHRRLMDDLQKMETQLYGPSEATNARHTQTSQEQTAGNSPEGEQSSAAVEEEDDLLDE